MDIAALRALLNYDPETGEFTWRDGLPSVGGKRAGSANERGYIRIRVLGRYVYAHRLAFAFLHDRWPSEVDHADGDRSNNRAGNLRECTRQQNQWNAGRKAEAPSSRFKGVYWCKQKRKWHARICVDRKAVHLGFFSDESEAGAAYAAGAARYAGEFARVA